MSVGRVATQACCLPASAATSDPTANALDDATDPTRTLTLRQAFMREVGRRFRALRGRVRRKIGYETDALRLARSTPDTTSAEAILANGATANADDEDDSDDADDEPFSFGTRADKRREFVRWLATAIDEEIVESVPGGLRAVRNGGHWTASYIADGYARGWVDAARRLRERGIDVEAGDLAATFDRPIPRRQVRDLYARAFENLTDITDDMAAEIRTALSEGLTAGLNPRRMADRMTETVDTIERDRARTLARTEIMNSHSTASLDRYEDAGTSVVAHGEWADAGDDRVCPICETLEGNRYSISRMRTGTFEFDASDREVVPDSLSGTYQLRLPAHPNGRCAIIPIVT
jgi:SPP1 gp7 family putative phage head morphogenesis protein